MSVDYYCTLFDSGYLTRGLSLYQSLLNTGEPFFLYVFAFDNEARDILQTLSLSNVQIISLQEFEDERLLKIKKDRTRQEYSWTCGCFSILYVLTHFKCSEVTYLDSDIFFFNMPSLLLDEFHESGKDVMITKHRYTPEYDQSDTSGIFCVQFMTFKNNEKGLTVLNWWCDRCEEWCYARFEDGKFGDQKYLDDWESRFDCVHVLEHLGGGVAPWNVQQYDVTEGPCVNQIPVVFYHFHNLKWFSFHKFELSSYRLSREVIDFLYIPYISMLQMQHCNVIKLLGDSFDERYAESPNGFLGFLRRLKRHFIKKTDSDCNIVYNYPSGFLNFLRMIKEI